MNAPLPALTTYTAADWQTLPLDLAITGGTLLTPNGHERLDVGIAHGRIVFLGQIDALPPETQRLDATGRHVLPGCMDTQVHFREPGLDYKEDLESGTRSAVMGGITAVFEMPNTTPNTTTEADIADKLQRAKGRAWCHHAFYVGACAENIEQLPALEQLAGVCGVKLFMGSSTGSLLVEDDATIRRVLQQGRRRMAVHAEDNARLDARKAELFPEAGQGYDVSLHPHWRDATTALLATQRLLALAEETGRPVHVLHVSTAEEMQLLAAHKHLASVEVLPQHLVLAAPECYQRLGTLAQMNPPIRGQEHQAGLWWGIENGVVDVLGSDHAPHTLEEKQRPYPQSPSGMTGVQTLLPLMLNEVAKGRLSLERLVDLLCEGPVRLFGIAGKGRIALGFDADFTLVDLARKETIRPEWIQSKVGWSPFVGEEVMGWPTHTVIAGKIVMQEGQLLGVPSGRPLAFV